MDDLNDNEIIIGYLDFEDDLMLEDTVGEFSISGKSEKDKNLVKVCIYDNEGDYIPHFHFESKKLNLDGCVEICNRRYFHHGKHTSTLNNKACKRLNDWLANEHNNNVEYTNWEYIIGIWNRNRYKIKLNEEIINQPDYSKLNNEYYYRVYSKDGVGIYNVLKKELGYDWLSFKKSNNISWLPILLKKVTVCF